VGKKRLTPENLANILLAFVGQTVQCDQPRAWTLAQVEMDILTLINGLPISCVSGDPQTTITDLTDDSRTVTTGSLFIARSGATEDGSRYIADALKNGAAAILTAHPDRVPPTDALILACDDPRALTAELASRFFDHPSRKISLIGITGTNGKTTTATMIRHLLNAADTPCGLIGTVEIDDGQTATPASLTTPGIIEINRLLARMIDHGCTACAMEVSSHALDQGRVATLDFDAAIFTNLTGDHLDYHGTMDAYAEAKSKLFAMLDHENHLAVLNHDDPASTHMARAISRTDVNQVWYGLDQEEADYHATIQHAHARGTDLLLTTPRFAQRPIRLPLVGRHNVANLLAALAVVEWATGAEQDWADAVSSLTPVPGRLEPVRLLDGSEPPFAVLVDYAHTDDALKNVLTALRPLTGGRLRVLFGCGGDRDKTKRPRMAAIACEYVDDIFITSDNPRTEDPEQIIADIRTGVPTSMNPQITVTVDRAEAIVKIIESAEPHDIVLLAGKGHEDYQIIGHDKRPFDDRIEAGRALAARFDHGECLSNQQGEQA
jgi:UDP-N-acetylmuramoyl-L-alanyl-D-glutamate--2,6-diaminopimelate ligase